MYAHYFGLKENPFNLTPDSRYLFLSPRHREALNHLIYGITERKGFIVVTGSVGTGKTTISRALLAHLDSSVDTAVIFNSGISDRDLLSMIVREFDVKLGRGRPTRRAYIDALNGFLVKNFAAGRNAVLLIDEAQNLAPAVLEQIRMLSNLETEREKLLQIVLLGQPELERILGSPSLRQLNERIAVRCTLEPLDRIQTARYIAHRVAVADGNGASVRFTTAAEKRIFRASGGNPRKINVLCDRALLVAFALDHHVIDGGILRKAVRDIGPAYLGSNRRAMFRRMGATVLVLAAMLAILGFWGRDVLVEGIRALAGGAAP
ncbi:MAG: hypothetical protein AVO39_03665 [delta proteobacterium MLS_D]|jgi:general secretion pathway protein A|nr:MAG: hypothetical protein AVO39_03665 [delta proteobacterium MLS_D]